MLGILAAVVIAAIVILSSVASKKAAQNHGAADIGGLADALKKTAEKTLSPPALANEQLVIAAPLGSIEARAQHVIDAAIQSGGTAVKTSEPDGTAILLVRIPGFNTELFHGLLRGEQVTKEKDARDGAKVLIEVRIKPEDAAPPRPPAPQP